MIENMLVSCLAGIGALALLLIFSIIGFFFYYVFIVDRKLQRQARPALTLDELKEKWAVKALEEH